MKLSKVFHIVHIIIGFAGIITAVAGVFAGAEGVVWGLSREHLFACSALLILIAIWVTLATIHHLKLEEKGERI